MAKPRPSISWPLNRRSRKWDPPTQLDRFLESPLRHLIYYLQALLLYLRGPPFQPPRNKPAIRIVCISDTHCQTLDLPSGYLLIHAGDAGQAGTVEELQKQMDWLDSQPHTEKIFVAGNHDSWFDPKSRSKQDSSSGATVDMKSVRYLENESVTLSFKGGRQLNIYGSPDIPLCGGSNFAFQYTRSNPPWKGRMPRDTDILITHSPPKSHCDLDLGCTSLAEEIWRVQPKLHVSGHVHSAHGREPLFWDEGQKAYERIMTRNKTGILKDVIPSQAWVDALKVFWHGINGILWQRLMAGGSSGVNGSLMVNAALLRESTKELSYPVEVVEL